ncbi:MULTISPECIES: hypothetical protein [unclassified Gordonia (in: high G+C Gram-positive bacteria)]|uniref:hypothetical protein n=1 Tax=unclassified Gordonia (in: high G+C Gram-positive bacteria) TaxID=2657482 RepID=UPI001963FC96|nr:MULTISPECIES: hypothetical protein [unclassified Gordonia (in: high G+C Gram-positive bacteria)]MBN0975436.1 hypothetical protein [Gordonia sp. BP-119]MBN0985583.1 hypothetical protein [Gordonia sp. BP-94]
MLNGAYTILAEVFITKVSGNGVAIGKTGAAIAHRLHNLMMREVKGNGIYTHPATGATDGMWSNLDIGNTGLSGVRLDTGAQNLVNVHVWGSGLESDTDKDGFWLNSPSNSLAGCQSEKNLGRGVRITANANRLTGCGLWGNAFGAVYMLGAQYNVLIGNQFYRNSVSNTGGTTSTSYAVVFLENCIRNTSQANTFWDTSTELTPGNYVTAPTYPYPGRAAIFTHAMLYAEPGTSDNNVILGNNAPREITRLSASTAAPYVFTGNGDIMVDNNWGAILTPTRAVASGAVRIPPESDTIIVAVSQEITSVLGARPGRVARIIFTNVTPLPVRDNGTTLNLAGDFSPVQNSVLTLVSDGTNWYETARSTN